LLNIAVKKHGMHKKYNQCETETN